MVTVSGRVVDYATNKPLAGVKIVMGTATFTTPADGKYAIQVPKDVPLDAKVTKDGYIVGFMPEESFSGDGDRGDFTLPDLNTYNLAELGQDGYDESLASVTIVVRTLPSCASDDGATLTVTAPSGTKTLYFKGGLPSASTTAVQAGQTPAISVYNVTPGAELQFTLSHPTCTQAPFPVTVGTATFTGKVSTEAGKASSALIVYLQ